jgi:hypothetical protein
MGLLALTRLMATQPPRRHRRRNDAQAQARSKPPLDHLRNLNRFMYLG